MPIFDLWALKANLGGQKTFFVTRGGKEDIENHFDAHYKPELELIKEGTELVLGSTIDTIPHSFKLKFISQQDALISCYVLLRTQHVLNH